MNQQSGSTETTLSTWKDNGRSDGVSDLVISEFLNTVGSPINECLSLMFNVLFPYRTARLFYPALCLIVEEHLPGV